MSPPAKRTARACERCRTTRRRCAPPYPCSQCVAAGVSCQVREKARPQRRNRQRAARGSSMDRIGRRSSSAVHGESSKETTCAGQRAVRPTSRDTYELVRDLARDLLQERYEYKLDCPLLEPPSCRPGGIDTEASLLSHPELDPPPSLTLSQAWELLVSFQKFMGWQDSQLVDIEELYGLAREHLDKLQHLSSSGISLVATRNRLPMDSLALLFMTFALGIVATGDFGHARSYFNVSTEMVKHFVGRDTFDLCLAYFLQHVFALRSGTSNYGQSIMVQAIRVARGLGLHENSYGTPGLQLFLIIYMADQYCSLTHNTEPTIETSMLDMNVFRPLKEEKPRLGALINLVIMNGNMIEQSHRPTPLSEVEVAELEARVSHVSSRYVTDASRSDDFRAAYEPLARIHTLCCRLRLRAPGLLTTQPSLSSICICLHSAQEILATYLELYRPVLNALLGRADVRSGQEEDQLLTPVASKLPVTWRQVRRIMSSAFIMIFAYCRGELVNAEASRYAAMARLLIAYPQWRWGHHLDEAVQTLDEIAKVCRLDVSSNMEMLFPSSSGRFAATLADPHAANLHSDDAADQVWMNPDVSFLTGAWPNAPQFSHQDQSNITTIEDQILLGLWEDNDIPIENVP